MKLNIVLIFSTVIWSFYEFSSIEGVDPNKRLDKGKGASTSHNNEVKCKCGKFFLEQLDEYVEVKGSDENVMELKYTTALIGRIGSGNYANVYHAHWFGENNNCVAVKIYHKQFNPQQEIRVLEFFNKFDDSERNHIIEMLGV
uniref:Serine-threonine/tyrosine-protein kinase catalytic domain-containing protein n=1 Tax=Meloidogyne enterolobii TaxID=390850 RepID=A0A6V7YBV2_MELEN|nr:unnamed protein product [Meloidogyne enterolobii]